MSSLTLVQGQFFLPMMIRCWRHFLTDNVMFESSDYNRVPSVFLSLNDWRIKHDPNEQCFGCGERASIFEIDDRGEQRYRMNWCTECHDEIRRTISASDEDVCELEGGEFSVVEVFVGRWVDGHRPKCERVIAEFISSNAATSMLAMLCMDEPDRHFVKRRIASGERNECGRPIERTCNISPEDCCRYTGTCACGRVTPPNSLECVDCKDYRGWFR